MCIRDSLTGDIYHHPTGIHHNEPVAVGDGVLHVVGDHEGGEVVLLYDLVGQSQHLVGGLGVQSGSVLVQQQQLRLLQGCLLYTDVYKRQ